MKINLRDTFSVKEVLKKRVETSACFFCGKRNVLTTTVEIKNYTPKILKISPEVLSCYDCMSMISWTHELDKLEAKI
jgi:hypothetical protein